MAFYLPSFARPSVPSLSLESYLTSLTSPECVRPLFYDDVIHRHPRKFCSNGIPGSKRKYKHIPPRNYSRYQKTYFMYVDIVLTIEIGKSTSEGNKSCHRLHSKISEVEYRPQKKFLKQQHYYKNFPIWSLCSLRHKKSFRIDCQTFFKLKNNVAFFNHVFLNI